MNIMVYASRCQGVFSEMMRDNGYDTFTTFYSDLSIAECFGADAIKDTYNRVIKEWMKDIKYITEFCMALNHKIFQHHEKNKSFARMYNDLWDACYGAIIKHYEGDTESLQYYYTTTD